MILYLLSIFLFLFQLKGIMIFYLIFNLESWNDKIQNFHSFIDKLIDLIWLIN